MNADADRLRSLSEAKLRALVRTRRALEQPGAPDEFQMLAIAGGAALLVDDQLWVYVAGRPERALGRALALLSRHQAAALHLVLDAGSGADARRAALLTVPVHIWRVDGTELVAVDAEPLASPADPPTGAHTADLVTVLERAGIDVVVEHGVISGEVRGLEVARISVGDDGTSSLDIGVGRFDQEASALLHGHLPTDAALDLAVQLVRDHRRPESAAHPVNRLARERWLRTQIVARPSLVGLDVLTPISPPVARRNVKDPAPASAIGHDPDGSAVLVVCTVGVDLEWVPVAADLVDRERPGRVVVVLPPRDLLAVQERLATLLPVPVTFVPVAGDWPA